MATTFIPSPTLEKDILEEPLLEHGMKDLAEQGLEIAKRLVPVDTGELQDSLHVEETENGGQAIVAGTDHWQFPEFGTSEMAAEPYLRPVIDEIGLSKT